MDKNAGEAKVLTTVEKPQEQHSSAFFSVDPGLIIWSWIAFFLLLFILARTTWRPIMKRLKDREAMVLKTIEDSKKAQEAMENALDDGRKLIEEAQHKVSEMIHNARMEAEKIANSIKDQAMEESVRLKKRAEHDIEQEKIQAITELRSELGSIVVDTIENVLKEKIDSNKSVELIDRSIKHFYEMAKKEEC